jgi:hypothetical protein
MPNKRRGKCGGGPGSVGFTLVRSGPNHTPRGLLYPRKHPAHWGRFPGAAAGRGCDAPRMSALAMPFNDDTPAPCISPMMGATSAAPASAFLLRTCKLAARRLAPRSMVRATTPSRSATSALESLRSCCAPSASPPGRRQHTKFDAGYYRWQFEAAWASYCEPSATPPQASKFRYLSRP